VLEFSAPDVAGADLAAFLRSMSPATADARDDPWLFSALVIGYLRLHNAPLWDPAVAALYSTQTRRSVVVAEGDTWSKLASTYLGNAELWPVLLLLNRDWVTVRGLELESGRWIWIADAGALGLSSGRAGE
jgi:nucleoid-associated protein YgaU